MASLVYLFERMVTSFSERRTKDAVRYAGVLSHFVADGLSPSHTVSREQLLAMAPPGTPCGLNLHAAIERSGAEQNRKDLQSMVKAACAGDERSLDVYRLRAARKAAGISADALYTLSEIGGT